MTLPIPPNPPPLPPRPCVTPETLGVGDDIVAQALHALSQFGEHNLRTATALLSTWARYDQLTDEQRDEVLAYYRPMTSRLALAYDDGAWAWIR